MTQNKHFTNNKSHLKRRKSIFVSLWIFITESGISVSTQHLVEYSWDAVNTLSQNFGQEARTQWHETNLNIFRFFRIVSICNWIGVDLIQNCSWNWFCFCDSVSAVYLKLFRDLFDLLERLLYPYIVNRKLHFQAIHSTNMSFWVSEWKTKPTGMIVYMLAIHK